MLGVTIKDRHRSKELANRDPMPGLCGAFCQMLNNVNHHQDGILQRSAPRRNETRKQRRLRDAMENTA